jgi:hypothetical protein
VVAEGLGPPRMMGGIGNVGFLDIKTFESRGLFLVQTVAPFGSEGLVYLSEELWQRAGPRGRVCRRARGR